LIFRQPTGRIVRLHRQLHWGARQLSWGLLGVCLLHVTVASRAGDSSVFVFSMQGSPTELVTPSVVMFCYIFASLRLSWCVIKLLHAIRIGVLILGNASGALICIF
jgi:hypothetical protein